MPAQTDPWAAAAAAYKPQPGAPSSSTPAPAANDDWKIWNQQGPVEEKPSFMGSYMSRLEDNAKGLLKPWAHPIDSILSYSPTEAIKNAGNSGLIQDITQNPDKKQGMANAAADLTTGMAIGGAFKAVPGIVRMARNIPETVMGSGEAGGVVRPSLLNRVGIGELPSSLSPIERSAVDITKAVNPPQTAWNNYLEATQAQTGNVIDYAKRNGLPINDARDFAKAAKGAADETRQHYQENFLKPHADQQVSVAGTGYGGKTIGEGQRATLGDVNDRIDAINRELKSPFRKPTPGQVSSALVPDADLLAEHQGLTNILHKSLGNLTGVAPEDIQALRVRGGQLSTLAGETQGAANAVSGGAAKLDTGSPTLPTNKSGLISEGITKLRGGPEKIAAGNLRKALMAAPIESSPLLQPSSPLAESPVMRPAPIRGPSKMAQTFDPTPDPRAVEAQKSKIDSRNAARYSLAASNKQSALNEFLHANDLEQAAQDAAYQRGQRTSQFKMSRNAMNDAQNKLEGEAARTMGRQNVLRIKKP